MNKVRAALIPGVQDTPGDWEAFREVSKDFLEVTRIQRPPYDGEWQEGRKWRDWNAHVLSDARSQIIDSGYALLMGHSGGTRHVVKLMNEEGAPKHGVLLNTPKQVSREQIFHEGLVFRRQVMNMLAPLIQEIPREIAVKMMGRHGRGVRDKSSEYLRIVTELKLHDRSPEVCDSINALPDDLRVLAFNAKNDPWYTNGIKDRENVEVIEENDVTHYAHVWRAAEIAQHVRSFCRRNSLIQ